MKNERKVFLFENAEDRDQTLMFFAVTAIIVGIIWIFKDALVYSIEHILSLFIGAFITLLNFHHKRKNGQTENLVGSPVEPSQDDISEARAKAAYIKKELERIKNGP